MNHAQTVGSTGHQGKRTQGRRARRKYDQRSRLSSARTVCHMPLSRDDLRVGGRLSGPLWPETIEVLALVDMGPSVKVIAKGLRSGRVHEPVLDYDQLQLVDQSAANHPLDGDSDRFALGVEALRLGLAYEYDPFFALSIARVDPLPHQLEAVYDYFLTLPRIRFLLADDPGAGKTIMAGLLIKELKARGLARRILVVAPANLTFQWQREMGPPA